LTIIDTTYLLPLARIDVEADLLRAVAEKKTTFRMGDIGVSLLSLFELQAKAAKLGIAADIADRATRVILETFTVVPFSDSKVVRLSFDLRKEMSDYVDCVIVATAAARRDDLVTEDSRIWTMRDSLHDRYGIEVLRYKDVIERTAAAGADPRMP
jgi:predicted nucleic acid-binding protein